MNVKKEVRQLLTDLGSSQISSTAYDTAWVARLAELGEPIGERALKWLRANQLPDGSWGAGEPLYYHDRVICTLAAITALGRRREAQDEIRLKRASFALESACKNLKQDIAGETVGFEMIVPMLMNEAKEMGLIGSINNEYFQKLDQKREAKLKTLLRGLIDRNVTIAFSAEMAGPDGLHLFDVDNLQEQNGSVGNSPSSSAYFIRYIDNKNQAALKYLYQLADNNDGGIPDFKPFDTYETAWVLWNLVQSTSQDNEFTALFKPHVDFLESAWRPDKGAAFAAGYTPTDGDLTSMVYYVLTHFKRKVNIDPLFRFEHEHHFRCYEQETDPSIGTNIHILCTLRKTGFEKYHPSVEKILRFLKKTKNAQSFWVDKWHVSPYYATSHAIIACTGFEDTLINSSVEWIIRTQRKDGAWGYYTPTAEETAYCLQALIVWKRYGGNVENGVLKRGVEWLLEHKTAAYSSLWISKVLSYPRLIILSTILNVLMSVNDEL